MKIRTKILLTALTISFIPAMMMEIFSLSQSREALKNQTLSHLESVREIKKAQLEAFFAERRADMNVLLSMLVKLKASPKWLAEHEDFFAHYIRQSDYLDLFLIHPNGKIFYTVKPANGGYSHLDQLVQKVLQSKTFVMTDFDTPRFGEPTAFLAQPLFHNNKIELVVALQLSNKGINQIMQERAGMGQTGETYIVGKRSKADPVDYLKGVVNTEATRAVFYGETGTKIIKNYRDATVLSAYTSLNIGNTTWAVIAEMEHQEIFEPIRQLEWWLSLSALLLGIVLLLLIFYFTKRLIKPLLAVNEHLKILAQGKMVEDEIKYSKNDEIGALVISAGLLKKNMKNSIAQANAIATGNYNNPVKRLSDQDELGQAFAEVSQRLRKITEISQAIAEGNYKPRKIEIKSEHDLLAMSINTMLDVRSNVISQVNRISNGDYMTNIAPRSDQDILGIALEKMTQRLRDISAENQKQNWLKTGKNELSEIMRGDQEIFVLSRHVITFLAKYLDAQTGVFYLYDEKNEELKIAASYAFNKRKSLNDCFKIGEGLIGQAALEQEMILITNLPKDYTQIISAIGEAIPRNVVAIPFVYEKTLKGVIELAAFHYFSETALEFLTSVMENIAISVNSAQSHKQLRKLLEKSQTQAEELQSQQEELRLTNEELIEHAAILKANEEKLEKQKENLQSANLALENARRDIEMKANELEKSSKYKSEFLANMSHELRTPLNSMLILSQQLSQNEEGNLSKAQVEAAQIVHSSGKDLLALINEILDLSKIEAGKMSLTIEKVNLSEIAQSITFNFKQIVDHKGLTLDVNLSQNLPTFIKTDIQRVNQILKNLLSNAIKFTKKGRIAVDFHLPTPKTTLYSLEPQQAIAISVIDTGIGIPKEKQQDIFEAFQQVDGSISRNYGGTGLGLSISRELTKLLGGEIQISSVEGQGSTFTLYLPKETAHEEKTPLVLPNDSIPFPHIDDDRDTIEENDQVILFIEDDLNFAKILYNFAHKNGFKCLHCSDGQTGIEIAEKYKPDAVILDIMLPQIDGWHVLNQLKDNMNLLHMPVHIISVEDCPHKIFHKGTIGCLTKPVSEEDLAGVFSKIKALITNKQMLVVESEQPLIKGKKILLVDDDMRNVFALSHVLQKNGLKVYKAANGQDALKILEK